MSENSGLSMKPIITVGIMTALSFAASSLSAALSGLCNIKFIGIVFKVIRFPFKFLGLFKTFFLTILIILLVLKFLIPIFSKIGEKATAKKRRKQNRAVEDAYFDEMERNEPMQVERDRSPKKMEF